MKFALTNVNDKLLIEVELDSSSVTHSTTNFELVGTVAEIAEQVKNLLTIHRDQKQQEESQRVAQEQANKKRRRFSNFSEDVGFTGNTFKKAVSLASVQKKLEQDGLAMNSGLPEVVRFRNTPYAYTVKATEWSSPFGSSGSEVAELLADIAKNVYGMNSTDTQAFVLKYSA